MYVPKEEGRRKDLSYLKWKFTKRYNLLREKITHDWEDLALILRCVKTQRFGKI